MRRTYSALATAGLLTLLTACSTGTDGSADAPQSGSPTEISVAAIAIADYAPVFYADAEGYFEDEGLTVEVQTMQGGAEAVPLLTGGQVQIAATNWVSYIQAVQRGLPVRAVLPGTQAKENFSAIVADAAQISAPADLAGKTIAVNQVKAISEFTSRASLKDSGVDTSGVKFVEIPLPEMSAALERGDIDAAWVVEPFLTGAKANGFDVALDVYSGSLDGAPLGGWIATDSYAAENGEVIDAFSRAVGRAIADLEDEEAFAAFLPTYTAMTPEVAAATTLPSFGTSIEGSDLQQQADLMAEFEFIDEPIDIESTLTHLRPIP